MVSGGGVDVHQHLWTESFVAALRRRRRPPRLDGWTLHLDGEPPSDLDPVAHDPDRRAALVRADGVDRALISLSSPLGIEYLPPEEAAPLLAAYHDDAAGLGAPFGAWAAAGLREIDAPGLADRLDQGFAGLQLPATALADDAGYAHCAPLLGLLEARDLPLFVHPGPVRAPRLPKNPDLSGEGGVALPNTGLSPDGVANRESPEHRQSPSLYGLHYADAGTGGTPVPDPRRGRAPYRAVETGGKPDDSPQTGTPVWWAAMVPYVQQMHAAWFAFHAYGRPRHPRLRVCFALLAGLAPLHEERLGARGGDPRGVVDGGVYLETSSYGPRAVDAAIRVLGIDVIVNGSDRPYASPLELGHGHGLGEAAGHALRVNNPARLLTRRGTPS
ncbi:amidohydrolase family protein [Rhizohabitans arisaemae]|uniref:amidohydrolase family protein n=1 Tax=Rhizohabitans arisaemae TaxID=2720610 RepID=UPI0024B1D5DD|nr:amidohydrolase family protein [Rhizohabitans arisaemae]